MTDQQSNNPTQSSVPNPSIRRTGLNEAQLAEVRQVNSKYSNDEY